MENKIINQQQLQIVGKIKKINHLVYSYLTILHTGESPINIYELIY